MCVGRWVWVGKGSTFWERCIAGTVCVCVSRGEGGVEGTLIV